LALRLELDAAALILEPLAATSALARAIGAGVIAPRARKVTRARVEHDRTDVWVDSTDPELAGMFAVLATAMTTREDAARNEARCRRASDRLTSNDSATLAATVRMAHVAAGCMAGTVPTSSGLTEMIALRDADRHPQTPFTALMRSLLLGVAGFRGDEHLARQQLERAAKLAADSGNTLLEARAIVAWGGTLVEIPSRVEQGLGVLERAATLLAHGDAPSLEHIAEHNRGSSLIIQGRYEEAAEHLNRARVAARDELSLEHEMVSCTNEAFAHVFVGNYEAATAALDELTEKRIASVSARSAAFAHIARSLYALLFQSLDVAFVELRHGLASAQEAEADAGDAKLLGELLGILYASARGESVDLLPRAGELEKLAQDHGFASFYWMANLRSALAQVRDDDLRARVEVTLERLTVMLEPIMER
jgi:tetratricopeptide (TPR) repeat protein